MTQRENIIEGAARMFAELGIKSIRMDDIAHELGISKRTLHETFSDKEELLYECMIHIYKNELKVVAEHVRDCSNDIEVILTAANMMLASNETLHRLKTNVNKFYPSLAFRLRHDIAEHSAERLCETIRRNIGEGIFDSRINVELSVAILYNTIEVFAQRDNIVLPENVSKREAFLYMIVNFFRGISTAKGVELIDRFLEEIKNKNL